jgi:hypothetical protein
MAFIINPYKVTPPPTDVITNHASATSASGTVDASSQYQPGFEPWRAFDGLTSNNDHWLANATSGWLRYQFALAKVLSEYRITGCSSGYGTNRSPNSWTFEGSDDGSSWTTLDTRSGQSGWGSVEQRNFSFSNSRPYKWYRLNVSAINGGVLLGLAELRLIGYTPPN